MTSFPCLNSPYGFQNMTLNLCLHPPTLTSNVAVNELPHNIARLVPLLLSEQRLWIQGFPQEFFLKIAG